MRAYARAGRRGEALRQYKSCAEILKRELGVAPDAETQALAGEIARPGSAEEAHGAGRGGTANGHAETPGSREQPPHPTIGLPAAPSPGTTRLAWPCLLSNIAVAVAPLRNLTGDPEQQYLVEAFTDDLVTDLLRHRPRAFAQAHRRLHAASRAVCRMSRKRPRIRRHGQRPAQHTRHVAG